MTGFLFFTKKNVQKWPFSFLQKTPLFFASLHVLPFTEKVYRFFKKHGQSFEKKTDIFWTGNLTVLQKKHKKNTLKNGTFFSPKNEIFCSKKKHSLNAPSFRAFFQNCFKSWLKNTPKKGVFFSTFDTKKDFFFFLQFWAEFFFKRRFYAEVQKIPNFKKKRSKNFFFIFRINFSETSKFGKFEKSTILDTFFSTVGNDSLLFWKKMHHFQWWKKALFARQKEGRVKKKWHFFNSEFWGSKKPCRIRSFKFKNVQNGQKWQKQWFLG